MDKKQLTNRTNFILFIVVILGFTGVFNYVFSKLFVRVDLTANKIYTISGATKRILRDLDDMVTIKVFISEKNLPPLAVNMTRTIRDLLSEYEAYSRGNVRIEYFDPTDDQELKNQARSMGLQEVPMQIIQKDKQENVMCFMGLAILYADKKENIPVLSNVGNLEYDLTSRILKATRTEVKKVAFYFGNGPHLFMPEEMQQQQQRGPSQSYNQARKELQEQFEVKDAGNLARGEKVPDDVTTLVLAGPKSLSDREKFEIDQFVMRGGRLIALIDAVEVQTQYGLNAVKQAHNSGDLFNHYGAMVNQNLVADLKSHTNITYQVNYGGFVLPISRPYPLWLEVIRGGFDPDCPAVSGLENMVFMWTSSIQTTLNRADTSLKVKASALMKTTPFAMEMADVYDLNPQRQWNTPKESLKGFDLAVMLSGSFGSFYAGKPIPLIKDEKDTTGKGMAPAQGDEARTVLARSPKTQIVLIGDSDFLSDGTPQSNHLFMTNLVEWFTLGDNLISIRSKAVTERMIDPKLSEGAKNSIRLFNMVGMPVIVILLGVFVFIRRRNLTKKGA